MNNAENIYLVHSCLPLSTPDDFVSFILSIIIMHSVIIIIIIIFINCNWVVTRWQ